MNQSNPRYTSFSFTLPAFFLLLIINNPIPIPPVTSASLGFDFSSFNPRNLTLLGDAYLKEGAIGLTRDVAVPTTSSGTVIYNSPVQFFDSDSNTTASFSTRFSFSISNLNPTSSASGDGLTFFLSPDNQTLGSPGGFLGLVNSSQLTKNRFIAVEFDTKLDPHFQDPDDNHVGLDIDSLISVQTANLVSFGIDLSSGLWINVWIDYKDDYKNLKVYLNYSDVKPYNPVLKVDIDLADYLKEFMFVGFSGSSEGSTEIHRVDRWSFQTFGFDPVRPKFRPHNVSDSSVFITTTPPPKSTISSSSFRQKRVAVGLCISVPAFCCALLVVFGWASINKWKGIKKQRSFKAEIVTGPREFTYKELKAATRGFHSTRILGHGAFGTVYKAFFVSTGTISAVKRSKHTHEGKTEFLAELSIIACLRHKNLVPLQGWCIEKDELLLVYEFMPNGSLDNALYSEIHNPNNDKPPLPWTCRYNIALGLASVLSYLHQECEQQVIHRDIKASNVMLDGNFNTRLGDFGLARLMEHDKSPISTLTAGTMGYLAPEYLQCGTASDKTDVFSYGVVILELACGRRPIEKEWEEQKMVYLVDYVWGLYGEGRMLEAADARLKGEYSAEEMERLLMVGLSCANPDCSERPSMRRVFQILNKEAQVLIVPKSKPTLVFSSSLPLSIEEIVASEEEDDAGDGNGDVDKGGEEKGQKRKSCEFIEVKIVVNENEVPV